MDENCPNLEDNDYIGYVEQSLSDLVSKSKDNVCTFDIKTDAPIGTKFKKSKKSNKDAKLVVSIEILKDNNLYALMDISGKD